MDRQVVVVARLGELEPQVDQLVAVERQRRVVAAAPRTSSMISSVSFLPLAFDQTCRVKSCSVPLSVPVLQS